MAWRPSALVYDPYLAELGGGERFAFAFAGVLERFAHVTVAGADLPDRDRLLRLGFPDTAIARLRPADFSAASQDFDLVVRTANHLPSPSRAAVSFLVVQFPFTTFNPRHPMRRARRGQLLGSYRCVTYSEFARGWIQRRWGVDAAVVHPPVELGSYEPLAKKNLILAVGRFFTAEHAKRQDVLVESYLRLPVEIRSRWRLVVAGGTSGHRDGQALVDRLRSRARGHDVEVAVDVPQSRLRDLYRDARLFWHAAGYQRPPNRPERAEHFGITVAEAMSYGAVPLVYDDGGLREVVGDGGGIRWRTADALVGQTVQLATCPTRMGRMARAGVALSRRYSKESFGRAAEGLLRGALS